MSITSALRHVARVLSLFGTLLVLLGVLLIALGGGVIAWKWWLAYTDPTALKGHGWAISPVLFLLGGSGVVFGGSVHVVCSWLGDRGSPD